MACEWATGMGYPKLYLHCEFVVLSVSLLMLVSMSMPMQYENEFEHGRRGHVY